MLAGTVTCTRKPMTAGLNTMMAAGPRSSRHKIPKTGVALARRVVPRHSRRKLKVPTASLVTSHRQLPALSLPKEATGTRPGINSTVTFLHATPAKGARKTTVLGGTSSIRPVVSAKGVAGLAGIAKAVGGLAGIGKGVTPLVASEHVPVSVAVDGGGGEFGRRVMKTGADNSLHQPPRYRRSHLGTTRLRVKIEF